MKLFPKYIGDLILNGRVEKLHYVSEQEKYAVILSHICANRIYREGCKNIICDYLQKLVPFHIDGKVLYIEVICTLLSGEMNRYYSTKQALDCIFRDGAI